MTQKQLGVAVGFDEKSADVRIAQYESGTRTPKQALMEKIAEVLDVNPRFLADDEILGAEGVIMMLFELESITRSVLQTAKTRTATEERALFSALS